MRVVMATAKGRVEVRDIPTPMPGEFEALVRMEACAICNSTDWKLLDGEFCAGAFPMALGHEVVGEVVEVGPGVKNFAPGDRVFRQRLADEHVGYGGRSTWGGMAEYGLVTDEWARQGVAYGPALPHDQQKLLLDVEPALAAGMVTLMECCDCMAVCGARAGASVAVVGSGPVGQALAMFARLLGAGPVWAFGRSGRAAERFLAVAGADGYVGGREWPGAVRGIVGAGGFDVVVEAVGSAEALDTCAALAGERGRVKVYGVAPASAPHGAEQSRAGNVAYVGAREGRVQGQVAAWVRDGQIDLNDWVSHRFDLEQCGQAFEMVREKKAFKAVLLP